MIGLIILGTCVVAGGLGCAAIASDDKKRDPGYRMGDGYDSWMDDSSR